MERKPEFDDIRPYYEEEIPQAMSRIVECDAFPLLASFVYPEFSLKEVKDRVRNFKTTREFQHDTMYKANEQIIARSISEFTSNGIQRLSPDKQYLYVSNHRDIMLDSSLMQYYFVKNGFETTEITFGANLMMNPVVIDIGKANKMFKVERPGGSVKDFYRASRHLSDYVRYVITEKGQSVWIAQRNGRTKDGRDATDQGIVKMFCLSEPKDKVKAISELNIVPVSISYEWESCDILKALELYQSQYTKYTKKPGEDLNSILTGILQKKGRVHIEFCEPLKMEEIQKLDHLTNNDFHKAIANLIDTRINPAYRLFPNNYIAHDILFGNSKFREYYSDVQYDTFVKRLELLNGYEETCDTDRLKEIFLGIYANPCDNR